MAGLASGDGCFYISIRKSIACKAGKAVVLKFQIVQHIRDIKLIQMLISFINCGRIELVPEQSAVYYIVTKFSDISEKLIPLFDKHLIKGVKFLDYQDFKKVIYLMEKNIILQNKVYQKLII